MYLSIRDDVLRAAGYTSLLEGLQELNIPGIELFVLRDNTVPALHTENGKERFNLTLLEDRQALQNQAKQHGITISAICMGNNFNAEDKEFELKWAINTICAASELQIPVVRIDTIMTGEKEMPLEVRQNIVAEMLQNIVQQTGSCIVDLGIENHGYQGNDPAFLQGMLNKINSPRVGLTLDSGNFYWRGWKLSEVYTIFEQFAPLVKHTHIKNIAYPEAIRETQREIGYEYGKYCCPIHEGDIDHSRYIELLRKHGYQRDICLEDESLGKYEPVQRKANLRASADYFRNILAAH